MQPKKPGQVIEADPADAVNAAFESPRNPKQESSAQSD